MHTINEVLMKLKCRLSCFDVNLRNQWIMLCS